MFYSVDLGDSDFYIGYGTLNFDSAWSNENWSLWLDAA